MNKACIKRNCRKQTFIYGCALTIISFGHLEAQAPEPITPTTEIDVIGDASEKSELYNAYLKATYQHATGRIHSAVDTYKKLFKKHPSQHAYNGFLNFLFDTEQFNNFVKIYESKVSTFDKAFGNNIDIQLMLAQAYLAINQEAKAEQIFVRLGQQYPDNEQVAYFSTIAFIKNNQLPKALDTIEASLKKPSLKQKHFLFLYLKSKIFVQQGKYPQALEAIEKSIEQFPSFNQGLLLKSVLLEQMGRVNDAIAGYKSYLDLVGRDINVEKQLVSLLSRQQKHSEAQKYVNQLKTNSPEYYHDQAMAAFENQNFKKALELFDKALKISPLFTPSRFGKIETLLQLKRIPELLTFMQTVIERNIDDVEMIHTLLVLRKTMVPTQQIIDTLKKIEQHKPVVTILASIADLSVEVNNYEQALFYYNKISEQTTDMGLKSKTLFQMGYIYFVTKQPAKLEHSLQQALQCEPVYPSVYNLLAYHYAQSNKQLPDALNLIDKALAQAPECHYYLDTKGYVLFKLGNKDNALTVFKQALEQAPDDMVIKQHLKAALENKL